MLIIKCDLCRKTIKEKQEKITIRHSGTWNDYALCGKCGEPVTMFLRKKKLLNLSKSKLAIT